MRTSLRALLIWTIVASLVLVTGPLAAGSGAVLEGLVVAENGRAAAAHTIHLIDDAGAVVAAASTDREGIYSFRDLRPGRYALGVENPEGGVAPVAGPPVQLAEGELARRDLKILSASSRQTQQAFQGNASLGSWWASLTPAAKAWSVVAIVMVAGITVAALDNDDNETPASEN